MDAPAGVTQEEGHAGLFLHLPPAVLALFFLARMIQPHLSLVDREVEFCVPASESLLPLLGIITVYYLLIVRENPCSCDCTEIPTHVSTSEGFKFTN